MMQEASKNDWSTFATLNVAQQRTMLSEYFPPFLPVLKSQHLSAVQQQAASLTTNADGGVVADCGGANTADAPIAEKVLYFDEHEVAADSTRIDFFIQTYENLSIAKKESEKMSNTFTSMVIDSDDLYTRIIQGSKESFVSFLTKLGEVDPATVVRS